MGFSFVVNDWSNTLRQSSRSEVLVHVDDWDAEHEDVEDEEAGAQETLANLFKDLYRIENH